MAHHLEKIRERTRPKERGMLDRMSTLDRLKGESEPVTFDECIQFVNDRDKVVQRMLRGSSGHEKFGESSEFGEFFVDQEAGMEFALVYLPSKISKEVGASIALLGIKPVGGVEGEHKLSQNERKERFLHNLCKVTGIFDMDHGYGAGLDIESPLIQALAKGRLKDPNTKQPMVLNGDELFVSFMTKGSGGTFLEPHEREGRDGMPTYIMDSTLAQYIEAKLELENLLTSELLSNLDSPQAKESRKKMMDDVVIGSEESWKIWTQEVLNTAELMSGYWVSNRTIVNKGHSMAGWEMVRLFVAQKYGRLRPNMRVFATRLINVHREKLLLARKYSEESLKKKGTWDGDDGKVWRLATKLINSHQMNVVENEPSGLVNTDSRELKLKELASIQLSSNKPDTHPLTTDTLGSGVVWGDDPNAMTLSLTPVVFGPNEGGGSERLSVATGLDKKECIPLVDMAKSPGLRTLIVAYQAQRLLADKGIRVPLGKIAFDIGTAFKLVEIELFKFVDENAFGTQLIRAVHTLQLSQYLSGVAMVDYALQHTPAVLSENTINQFTPEDLYIWPDPEINAVNVVPNLQLFEGTMDGVVSPDAIGMIGTSLELNVNRKDSAVPILVKHDKSGHYLALEMIEKMWSQILGRHRIVRYHRNEMIEELKDWIDSNNTI